MKPIPAEVLFEFKKVQTKFNNIKIKAQAINVEIERLESLRTFLKGHKVKNHMRWVETQRQNVDWRRELIPNIKMTPLRELLCPPVPPKRLELPGCVPKLLNFLSSPVKGNKRVF